VDSIPTQESPAVAHVPVIGLKLVKRENLVNFHGPQRELNHFTMRDSSFRERPESDKH